MIVWSLVAYAGQACFFSRFLVQWIASERAKRSVAPVTFWWLSLAGTVMMGAKTIASGDVVFTPGYLVNGTIYVRNLWLSGRAEKKRSRLGPVPAAVLALRRWAGPAPGHGPDLGAGGAGARPGLLR